MDGLDPEKLDQLARFCARYSGETSFGTVIIFLVLGITVTSSIAIFFSGKDNRDADD